jgi:hypothetical protein
VPRTKARAAIIPLGLSSRRGSSSLPEGCSSQRLAPLRRERSSLARIALGEPGRLSPPIWPCTTRGFPCLRCCHRSGGLLPHLFTLTKRNKRCEGVSQVYLRDATELLRRRSIFCGTFREPLSRGKANLASTAPLPRRYLARCPYPERARSTLKGLPVTGPCGPTTVVSGLSSRPAALRRPDRRSPGSPAIFHYIADWLGNQRDGCSCTLSTSPQSTSRTRFP